MSMSALTPDTFGSQEHTAETTRTVSTVWAPTPAPVTQVSSEVDTHEMRGSSSGYDYWAANAGCAEVDECTDPNYTSGST